MKKLFIAVLALSALVACNKDEVVQISSSSAIQFEQAFVDNATRAAVDPSTTTASLQAFTVYGFMDEVTGVVFDDEKVSKSGADWTYANTQYWLPGHTYYFAALAPVGGYSVELANTTSAAQVGVGKVGFTNANGTTDLIYSTAKTVLKDDDEISADYPGKVKLLFKHQLSKIKFTFENGFDNENAKIVVKDITMEVPKSGSIDLASATPAWTLAGTETTTLQFGTTATIEQNKTEECAAERLTIPAGADQDYKVTFVADLYYGDQLADSFEHEITLTGNKFEIGKAYNIKATLNAQNIDDNALFPIEFTAEVDGWEEGFIDNGGELFDSQVTDEATLKAALANGGNVVLQNSITISSALKINNGVVASLDLNGKTITNKVENTEADIFSIEEGGELTIYGDGEVTAVSGNEGYPVFCMGKVTINGGKYTSGKDKDDKPNACIYAKVKGEIYINGGEFKSEGNYTLNKNDESKETTIIEVRGGKFINFNPASAAADSPVANYLAEGFKSVLVDGSTTDYVVVPMNEVEKALQKGVTANITLKEDITMNSVFNVVSDMTIDLNGNDIKSETDDILFRVENGATLTITGTGNFETALYVASANQGGKIVVTGNPTFTSNTTCFQANGGSIEIYGGVYYLTNTDKRYMLNHVDGMKVKGSILVYGGTFNGYNPAASASENPVMNFVAPGYQSTETAAGSNIWTVSPIGE